jgi:RNA polymerase sigma-B factor
MNSTLRFPRNREINVTILTSAYVYSSWVGHTLLVRNSSGSRESTLTNGTLRRPTADTIGANLQPRSRAELKELSDNALLSKIRALPRDSELRAVMCEIVVERYSKLVRSCVRQYRGSPEPTEDLMQVGYVGLLKAINNYDPEVGDSLSAYAQPCVSGEIKRHFRDKRWQIHVRRSAQELLLELRKANEELTQQLGREPTEHELAERLGVSADDMQEARQADLVFSTYSLDAPLSDQEDPALLADVLGDDDPGVIHTIDMESVNAHWDELPEREQRILVMRFYGNLTQTEIGDRLGISQMHVSRLLARALAHLRSKLLDPSEDCDAAVVISAAVDAVAG